jgi:hypothetical protein
MLWAAGALKVVLIIFSLQCCWEYRRKRRHLRVEIRKVRVAPHVSVSHGD